MYQKKPNYKYDLEQRTLDFAKKIINLCKKLPKNSVNIPLSNQLVRAGTSPGANYREANETETKKDFSYKIRICRRESKESTYWLRLILHANPKIQNEIDPIIQESIELRKIFGSISKKSK